MSRDIGTLSNMFDVKIMYYNWLTHGMHVKYGNTKAVKQSVNQGVNSV